MDTKIWGIIGGVVLVLALLSPFVLGSSKKVEQLFEDAKMLHERSNYQEAIVKYNEALKESKKVGAKTEWIDKDFTTLANLKIAQCYHELAEKTSNKRHYHNSLTHITEVVLDAKVPMHQEELNYLWAEILYKTGDLNQAKPKFSWFIEKFPSSRWVPKALCTIGEINFKQENYNEALSAFQKLVDKFPHSELGVEAEQRIVEIENLVNNDIPPDPPKPDPEAEAKAMYNTASDLKQRGSVNAALQRYANVITQYPKSQYATKSYIDMGDLYFKMRDSANALDSYEKALDNLVETDDEQQKKEIYEKYHSVHLIPQYISDRSKIETITLKSNNLLAKANRLRAHGRYAAAAQEYEVFINTNPPVEDAVYALYWAGRCYHDAAFADVTLFRKSVDAFRRLIAHYADNSHTIEAYYRLILVYTDWAQTLGYISKWQLVINTVTEANTKYANSDNSSDQRFLGRMEPFKDRALKKLDAQKRPVFNHKLDNDTTKEKTQPDKKNGNGSNSHFEKRHTSVATEKVKEKHYGQGLTFLDQSQYTNAITQFQKAIEIDSQFKEAHCNLAVAYIEQEVYKKAIPPLKKAINIDPNFIEAHFNLSIAYLRLGRFADAKAAANVVLNIDANYEPAYQLLDSIAD